MRNIFLVCSALFVLYSCKNHKYNTVLQANIKGLRKGIIYFQKNHKDSIITVDSVYIKGQNKFSFGDNINIPEVYYLHIKTKDFFKIPVFMEQGVIQISIDMDNILQAKVQGSKNHDKLVEFKSLITEINHKKNVLYTELIKHKNDKLKSDSISNKINKQEKIRNLYILNFAFRNKNYAVAPYVVSNYLSQAPKKYLDSIVNSMGIEASKSKYGKFLKKIYQK